MAVPRSAGPLQKRLEEKTSLPLNDEHRWKTPLRPNQKTTCDGDDCGSAGGSRELRRVGAAAATARSSESNASATDRRATRMRNMNRDWHGQIDVQQKP